MNTIIRDKPSFIAGMELALRIVRNRAKAIEEIINVDHKSMFGDLRWQAVMSVETGIRIVQVEIGAGRMPLPEFTEEEHDEINRIA